MALSFAIDFEVAKTDGETVKLKDWEDVLEGKPPPPGFKSISSEHKGVEFRTGKPVSFDYQRNEDMRNPEDFKAPTVTPEESSPLPKPKVADATPEGDVAKKSYFHVTDKEGAESILSDGIDQKKSEKGLHGQGFYTAEKAELERLAAEKEQLARRRRLCTLQPHHKIKV